MCRDCACGELATEPKPSPATRELPLHTSLLQRNDAQAAALRHCFTAAGVRVVNLLSSPGSGKTALLEALALGTERLLLPSSGELLPRIC